MDSSKYNSLLQWMKTAEGKKQIAEAEKDAWVPFNKEFPNADKSKFISQAMVVSKGNVSAEIFLKKGTGNLQSVFGLDRKYWGAEMKKALGLADIGGFPYKMSPRTKVSLPIPANFAKRPPDPQCPPFAVHPRANPSCGLRHIFPLGARA